MELTKLKINTPLGTILGLVTGGLYWVLLYAVWSKRHAKVKLNQYEKLQGPDAANLRAHIEKHSGRTRTLAIIGAVMLAAALSVFGFAFTWEVILDKGPTPILTDEPEYETYFFMFLFLASAMVPITYGSLLCELQYILSRETAEPFTARLTAIPAGDLPALTGAPSKAGILILSIFHALIALGVLPLLFFPPFIAASINKYVRAQQAMWTPSSE